ncbi:penicillin-binding protein activator [Sphingomicrobium lutaoense]|uniref:ABC-type branched-subunit amino acid transport system substrate-binding protein n=1 Tax=Sphingomicrobium lutaoense TaxID=515949 RepID=A0A839YZY2_9SPHN|nr:penicillin-binding protein activator [Sphingomicrobium lutaoense]MBB3764010.1 ABC-type branched-subunit amino acid transport system substrate-binding protein [Sphingomicrobium lutaoense]
MAAGTLALAGCQTAPKPTEEPATSAPPPTAKPTPRAVERNEVALLVPLSGDNAGVGTSIANAAKMALIDMDTQALRLTIYDTAGPGGARAAVNDALGAGSGLILGPLLSENVRAVSPAARQAGVPVIAFSNDEEVAGDGVYILGFTPSQSIARSVSWAKAQGAKEYSALVPSGEYGQRASRAFLRSVDAANGNVRALEVYNRQRAAIDAAVDKVKARGPVDAILIADSGRIASYAASRLQLGGQLMGTELWAAEDNLGQTRALQGAIYAAVPDNRFDQLVARYRARYNVAPFRLASLGYDAMLLAVRASSNWPAGRPFPREILRDRDGFGGVDGIFRFDRSGVAQRALEVRRVTASGIQTADAAPSAF